jgi:hypothetical protein
MSLPIRLVRRAHTPLLAFTSLPVSPSLATAPSRLGNSPWDLSSCHQASRAWGQKASSRISFGVQGQVSGNVASGRPVSSLASSRALG